MTSKEYFVIYQIKGKELFKKDEESFITEDLFIVENEKVAKHYCKNHDNIDYKVERIDYDENGELEDDK